jgi:hypothetical protein
MEVIMTKLIMLSLCLGFFAGMPLISAAQAEALNQGQITYADEHGTSTQSDPMLVPYHQENSISKVGCGAQYCP